MLSVKLWVPSLLGSCYFSWSHMARFSRGFTGPFKESQADVEIAVMELSTSSSITWNLTWRTHSCNFRHDHQTLNPTLNFGQLFTVSVLPMRHQLIGNLRVFNSAKFPLHTSQRRNFLGQKKRIKHVWRSRGRIGRSAHSGVCLFEADAHAKWLGSSVNTCPI